MQISTIILFKLISIQLESFKIWKINYNILQYKLYTFLRYNNDIYQWYLKIVSIIYRDYLFSFIFVYVPIKIKILYIILKEKNYYWFYI